MRWAEVSGEFFTWVIRWHRQGKAVVLGSDINLAAEVVFDGHVDAAVTELHLVGFQPQRATKQLVAEANAEEWNLGRQHLANKRNGAVCGCWITRTVGDKDAVWVVLLDISERGARRNHDGLNSALCKVGRASCRERVKEGAVHRPVQQNLQTVTETNEK